MTFITQKLTSEFLQTHWQDFLHTLVPIHGDETTSRETILAIFERNKQYETIFITLDSETNTIVGSVRALLDYKYIRGGSIAGRIEEIVVCHEMRGQGIGKLLMQEVTKFFKEQGCYKVTLACKKELIGYYEKFGFTAEEIGMKYYSPSLQ